MRNRKGGAFPHIKRQSRKRLSYRVSVRLSLLEFQQAMSEINVQLNDGAPVQVPGSTTVAEALKKLDRDIAKQALAARVNGREVDLAYTLDTQTNGDAIKI